MFTPELRARVKSEVARYIELANTTYGLKLVPPTIEYTLRGRTAGWAQAVGWKVNFNTVLLVENVEAFIARTVPHEVAHLVDHVIETTDQGNLEAQAIRFAIQGKRRRKREVHGFAWQSVMTKFGVADITRCHKYDTTNSRVRTKEKKRFEYKCACNKIHRIGPKYHKHIAAGNARRFYFKCCRTMIRPDHLMKAVVLNPNPIVAIARTAPAPTPPAPKPANQPLSKAELALRILRSSPDASRDEIIARIMSNCGMSKAGASTYYYAAKAKLSAGQ